MTPRQEFILKKLQEGISQAKISIMLGTSKRTIYEEVKILRKLGKLEKKRDYRAPIQQSLSYQNIEDVTIRNATSKNFTDEQATTYELNKDIPRSQLSRLMGIDRLSMNFMIEKYNATKTPRNAIIENYKLGITTKEIARVMNLHHNIVLYHIRKMEEDNEVEIYNARESQFQMC